MELIKFRRQYLITSNEVAELDGWQKETFNGMNVYAEHSLEINKIDEKNKEFLLLGYWINPHSLEKTNSEILNDMNKECSSFETVLKFLYPLSGRFALFCRFGESVFGVSDAGGFRPIFFTDNNEELNITSNIFLLKYVMNLKEKKEKYLFEQSNFYKLSETFGWCPGYTFYQNVESVIANHYLNINERKIYRFYPSTKLTTIDSESEIKKTFFKISELLNNSITGIVKRGPVSFSLTAGYDSRMILSAAKEQAEQMYFWISYNSEKQSDYFLPRQILNDAGLKHYPIKNSKQKYKEYKDFYFSNTPMAHDIWCKYYSSMVDKYPDNMLVIRGSGAGIIKMKYYKSSVHPNVVDIPYLNNNISNFSYLSQCSFLSDYMSIYLKNVQEVCKNNNYKTLDVLEQECREGGQWQAQSQLESDFLHDVFVPLSNREIFDLFLQLPDEYRNPKEMKAYKEIIKIGWPDLLNYPFNPPSKYSKFELKMQYYKEAAKFKLKKMFGK